MARKLNNVVTTLLLFMDIRLRSVMSQLWPRFMNCQEILWIKNLEVKQLLKKF